ncbi:bifunctional glutamate N-acetyltransferase/amino-acid acetyltransferase ArgJ [Actinocatenispora rupis]|uniref:Arginine biosynthesis bifunctional protein ArgJ n=1 Tax=Actinocatenispora rupis TaxID=519421 RepID=A0A8J3IYV0_9ACTN|nr:bifunctional glutamate N-acetyltransferase/amino-acid acetyltransferase ArgJ [Actinocatenispora rupis]GID11153.1 arginine biosynthesis bifunctional protein ArgJ [Actinocatenispora rupis]
MSTGETGVTAPAGFRAAGVAAGIKQSGAPDVALVVNDGPDATAAGVFTRNRVKAAPVLWSERVLAAGIVKAVVLNAGNANACTGPDGFGDTHATAERVAIRLGIGPADVAVCSTGLIGERLPVDALLSGVDGAAKALSRTGGGDAAEAIRTTDTRAKQVRLDGDGYVVGGMAKGAGMLAPALATMLCVLTTDAVADTDLLNTALRRAVAVTFERIDSDGCLSTNDTVLLLASGASGVSATEQDLTDLVTAACADLAGQLLADAEGATKEVAIEVTGAASEDDAVEVGRAIARNNLVKTALFGNDPNWGRILAAIGTTSAEFAPERLDVAVNGVWICRNGCAAADRSGVDLSGRAVTITAELHAGSESATVWTNDLSHAYVHENSAYST